MTLSVSVIVPARNAAAVLDRTLDAVEPLAGTGTVGVIVAASGGRERTTPAVAPLVRSACRNYNALLSRLPEGIAHVRGGPHAGPEP